MVASRVMLEGLKQYAFGAGQISPVLCHTWYVSAVCLANTLFESYQYSASFSRRPPVVNNGATYVSNNSVPRESENAHKLDATGVCRWLSLYQKSRGQQRRIARRTKRSRRPRATPDLRTGLSSSFGKAGTSGGMRSFSLFGILSKTNFAVGTARCYHSTGTSEIQIGKCVPWP